MTHPLPHLLHSLQAGLITIALLVGLLVARLSQAAPGDLDPLDANVVGNHGGAVHATAVQPDGKIVLAGRFFSLLGVSRNNIARLNADGTLDTGFNPNVDGEVNTVAVQADGKVLLGGWFGTLQPNGAGAATARQCIARVHADGTLDTGFDPKAGSGVHSIVVQADGKVLLGGEFTTLQPNGAMAVTTRNRIARVNVDGTLDTGFDPNVDRYVYSLAVQADGKVLIGGWFNTLQPNGAGAATTRQSIARVNADGTLDTGFDPKANDPVNCVVVQADGKVLLGGEFKALQPNGAASATPRNRIARVNMDGTLDTGFDPKANSVVKSIALQADGKVLLGGEFTSLQPNGADEATPRKYIARVNADGTLDTGLDPNANNWVFGVAVQTDGKVLIGGQFTTLQPNGAGAPTARNLFARLVNDPATQTLTAPDSTQTLWTRDGSAPELSRATFELSTNGGTVWTPLGDGTRLGTTGNWQLTGLALPSSGQLRARGVSSGGSGLIEQVISYSPTDTDGDGLLDSWELTYWPTTIGHGPLDDSDHDGYCELLELAFGLNPTLPSAGGLPSAIDEGGYLTMTITKQAGVTYEVQRAGSLVSVIPPFSSLDTIVITNNATTLKVRDNLLIGTTPHRFMRVKVTAAP